MRSIGIRISPGELIDRVTILKIKASRILDDERKAAVQSELDLLAHVMTHQLGMNEQAGKLIGRLTEVNRAIWDAEDTMRLYIQLGTLGQHFIAAAVSAVKGNDERAELKRQINAFYGDPPGEIKEYLQEYLPKGES